MYFENENYFILCHQYLFVAKTNKQAYAHQTHVLTSYIHMRTQTQMWTQTHTTHTRAHTRMHSFFFSYCTAPVSVM